MNMMMISSHPLFYFMALFRALVKDKQENKHSENIPLHQWTRPYLIFVIM